MKRARKTKTEPVGSSEVVGPGLPGTLGSGRVGGLSRNYAMKMPPQEGIFLSPGGTTLYPKEVEMDAANDPPNNVVPISKYVKTDFDVRSPVNNAPTKVIEGTDSTWDGYRGVMFAVDKGEDKVDEEGIMYAAWLWLTTPIPYNTRYLPPGYFRDEAIRDECKKRGQNSTRRSAKSRGKDGDNLDKNLFPDLPSKINHRKHLVCKVKLDKGKPCYWPSKNPGRVKYAEELIFDALVNEVSSVIDGHVMPENYRLIRPSPFSLSTSVVKSECKNLEDGYKVVRKYDIIEHQPNELDLELKRYLANPNEPPIGNLEEVYEEIDEDVPWDYGAGFNTLKEEDHEDTSDKPLSKSYDLSDPEQKGLHDWLECRQTMEDSRYQDRLWLRHCYPELRYNSLLSVSINASGKRFPSQDKVKLDSYSNIGIKPTKANRLPALLKLASNNPEWHQAAIDYAAMQSTLKVSTPSPEFDDVLIQLMEIFDRHLTGNQSGPVKKIDKSKARYF